MDAGDTKTFVGISDPSGTFVLNNGEISFAATPTTEGTHTFTYTIQDTAGATSTATATVIIAAPINININDSTAIATLSSDGVGNLVITANTLLAIDPNFASFVSAVESDIALGTASVVGNEVVFVPAEGLAVNTATNLMMINYLDSFGTTKTGVITTNNLITGTAGVDTFYLDEIGADNQIILGLGASDQFTSSGIGSIFSVTNVLYSGGEGNENFDLNAFGNIFDSKIMGNESDDLFQGQQALTNTAIDGGIGFDRIVSTSKYTLGSDSNIESLQYTYKKENDVIKWTAADIQALTGGTALSVVVTDSDGKTYQNGPNPTDPNWSNGVLVQISQNNFDLQFTNNDGNGTILTLGTRYISNAANTVIFDNNQYPNIDFTSFLNASNGFLTRDGNDVVNIKMAAPFGVVPTALINLGRGDDSVNINILDTNLGTPGALQVNLLGDQGSDQFIFDNGSYLDANYTLNGGVGIDSIVITDVDKTNFANISNVEIFDLRPLSGTGSITIDDALALSLITGSRLGTGNITLNGFANLNLVGGNWSLVGTGVDPDGFGDGISAYNAYENSTNPGHLFYIANSITLQIPPAINYITITDVNAVDINIGNIPEIHGTADKDFITLPASVNMYYTINAGNGDDVFKLEGYALQNMNGGDGIDTLDASANLMGLRYSPSMQMLQYDPYGTMYYLSNIERFIGTNFDDLINVSEETTYINGGLGVNEAVFNYGYGLGQVVDMINHEVRNTYGTVVATFENIQNVVLGSGNDTVIVSDQIGTKLNASSSPYTYDIDTIDLSQYGHGVYLVLSGSTPQEGYITTLDGTVNTVSIYGFENVIGSSQDDTIFIGPEDPFTYHYHLLDGGAGNDTLAITDIDSGILANTTHFETIDIRDLYYWSPMNDTIDLFSSIAQSLTAGNTSDSFTIYADYSDTINLRDGNDWVSTGQAVQNGYLFNTYTNNNVDGITFYFDYFTPINVIA